MIRQTIGATVKSMCAAVPIAALFLIGVLLISPLAVGQGSTASVSVTSGGEMRLSVGPYLAEPSARLAIELACQDGALADCETLLAIECRLIEEDGSLIRSIVAPEGALARSWIAAVDLVDEAGTPLPAGRYHMVLETTSGEFTAIVDVVPTHLLATHGTFSATAIANGLSLRVSRMVTPDDAEQEIAVRIGDELLVALPGNPTTGFEWQSNVLYEYAVLRPVGEVPYKFRSEADPHLVGSPGVFLFRYQAIAADSQWFRFAYSRPWESVQPAQVVEFTVVVH